MAAARETASGVAGTSIYAGRIDDWLDENTKTRGTNWYGEPGKVGEGQKMLADAHARRARDGVTDALLAAYWDIEPGDDSELGSEIADFVKYALFEILPWFKILQTACNGYIRDGFALFEKTETIKTLPQGRFKKLGESGFVYSGFHYRPAWTVYQWKQSTSDPTQLSAVVQHTMGSDVEKAGLATIDAKHIVRFTWEQEGANFEGYPIFRSAWGPWFAKRVLTKVELISHEKNHIAQPHVTLPQDTEIEQAVDDLDRIATALAEKRAHHQGFLIIPPGYAIDYKSGQASTNIQLTIERLNFDIAHAFGSAFMVMGRKSTGASFALADTQEGQYNLTLQKHAKFIEMVFNVGLDGWSPIEHLVRANYGNSAPVPKLVARNLPTVNWTEVLPNLFRGIRVGALTMDDKLESFIRRVTNAPASDPTTRRALPGFNLDGSQQQPIQTSQSDAGSTPGTGVKKDTEEDSAAPEDNEDV